MIALAFILIFGNVSDVSAQGRDPFIKNGRLKPKSPSRPQPSSPSTTPGTPAQPTKPVKKGPVVVAPPPIESRIEYYKRIREQAAMNGQQIPKVTSVLLLNEFQNY